MPEIKYLDVIGSGGLQRSYGRIETDFLRKMQGDGAYKVYREMINNSSAVGAARFAMRSLMRSVNWWVEPADESPEANDQAEFVESCLLDMETTWENVFGEILSYLDYGWAFCEIVMKLRKGPGDDKTTASRFDDGRIGWRKIFLLGQDTRDKWEWNADDDLIGMWQKKETGGSVLVPLEKAILFRTETDRGNPEGRSIYRNAVVDYQFLKRTNEFVAIGVERDLAGLPKMEVPIEYLATDANAAQKALVTALSKMLSALKRDEQEFIMMPSKLDHEGKPTGFDFSLVSTGGRRALDLVGLMDGYKKNILQSVLAQFVELGMGQTGSFALASNQTDLFAVALGAFLNDIASTFNRAGIGRLMNLNEVPQELWPTLTHGDLESLSLVEMGQYIGALTMAGIPVTDDATQRKLREMGGLPPPVEQVSEGVPELPAVAKSMRRGKFLRREYVKKAREQGKRV